MSAVACICDFLTCNWMANMCSRSQNQSSSTPSSAPAAKSGGFCSHGPCTPIIFLWDFAKSDAGWWVNLALAHGLFWGYGYEVLYNYGYTNAINPEVGNIPSGSLGSGIVIITLLIVVIMTFIWFEKLWTHEIGASGDIGLGKVDDDEE